MEVCHIDGSMLKTCKSKFLRHLETFDCEKVNPYEINTILIDAMFFLRSLNTTSTTFGNFARTLLLKLCRLPCNEIHFVSDKYITPSIKDFERAARGEGANACEVIGKSQKISGCFSDLMRSKNFKTSLIKFLASDWMDGSEYAAILGQKVLFLNVEDCCYKYEVINNVVIRTREETLFCTHEEADTRLIYHASQLSRPSNVIIRMNDTDVLVIALGNFSKLNGLLLWLDVGLHGTNTRRYINVNNIYSKLGNKLSSSLPAFHALTGSDCSEKAK